MVDLQVSKDTTGKATSCKNVDDGPEANILPHP